MVNLHECLDVASIAINLPISMEPTFVPVLRNEKAITIDYNIWGSYIAKDLLKNVFSSTYVLITDTNLHDLYVPSFEKAFNDVASSLKVESRLLTYTIPPGENSKSRTTKAEVEDWMLSQERDPPLDVRQFPSSIIRILLNTSRLTSNGEC